MGDGSIPVGRGVVPGQVAEIIVTLDGGPGPRGSGYRVGPTTVLTAAHVVEGAVAVRVRFDADLPGEWTAEVVSCWADPRSDLAVLTIVSREGEPAVVAARFGRIGAERAAVLAARAVGFPRFKLKTDDDADGDADRLRYRDSHQADGSVAVLSNRREGTLELTVPPPERDPDPEVSPWEGMSGAAVWVGDRIVGVIAKHHRADGLGRLAATRLDLALAGLEQQRQAELRTLLGLPDVLPDVVPHSTGEWVRTAYQAQVRDIAPDQLLDREAELDELVAFCAGDQPYAWWQAGPWAGKSALMSWFVLHPPAGVDVVSFFATARLGGQSDSHACTAALIEQLAALLGESPATLLTAGARRGTMLRLLDDAAHRTREAGRRLLLMIDGLDEDSGTTTGPSIAALLPRRPAPEVRILVASRPHPPIPDDVPGDHPLRIITPRQLVVSEHARDVERRARHELTQLLAGLPLQRDVLGLITAAGGGLTLADLEELTRQPPYQIEYLLGGLFGRSIGSRSQAPAVGRGDERVYLFTHETLHVVAEQQFGNSLAAYRDRLHVWADNYRQRGWPVDTPQYLLRSYPPLLDGARDLPRLVSCATDQVRHDRMRRLTGGDALALTEIRTAQQLILSQPDPDLASLVLLTVQRDHLIDRNSSIPTELPAVWAMLGQPNRAEALTNSIRRPYRRADALARVAAAAAAVGDHDRATSLRCEAEKLTAEITDPDSRMRLLVGVAQAGGDHDRAEALTGQITDPYLRTAALARVMEAVAAGGDHDRVARLAGEAEALTGQITDPNRRAAALARVAAAAAAVGDHDRAARLLSKAEALTGQITDPDQQEWAIIEVAAAVAACGDHDRAEALAGEIAEPDWQCWALGSVAKAVAICGDHDRAEALIKKIGYEDQSADALAQVAAAVAAGGDHDRAVRLADEAETFTAQSNPYGPRMRELTEVAKAMATIGDHDRAEVFTAQISSDCWRRKLRGVAEVVAAASDHDPAEVLTRHITESVRRMGALGELVRAAVASDYDRAAQLISEAEALGRRIADPDSRREALVCIAKAAAAVSDYDRAVRLADEAEALTRFPIRSGVQSSLAQVVEMMAAGGDHDRAEALARRIVDPDRRARTLARLARILVETDKETSQVPEHARSSSPLMLRARHLLAAALEAGSWIEVVASLARIDPVAVSVLADEVRRRWGLDSSSGSRYGGGSVVVEASNDQARHVFISYVREDVGSVDRLVRVLRERGVEVWLDRDGIQPGVRWAEAIREAIRNGSFFLACFSTSYALRECSYMHEELALAVDELRKRRFGQTWFIPVLLDDGEIPDIPIGSGETLRSLQWVSLYEDWDAGMCKILAAVSPGEK